MAKVVRKHAPTFKATVALAAIKEEKTIAELTSQYGVHPTQINRWKQQALASLVDGFGEKHKQQTKDNRELIQALYQEIGKLKMEVEFLKKKLGLFSQD